MHPKGPFFLFCWRKYYLDFFPFLWQMTFDVGKKRKGRTARNKHEKYESSMTYHSTVMTNVIFLCTKREIEKQEERKLYNSELSIL